MRQQPAPSDGVDVAHGLPGRQDLVRQRLALDIHPGGDPFLAACRCTASVRQSHRSIGRSVGQRFRRTAKLIDRDREDRLQVALMLHAAVPYLA